MQGYLAYTFMAVDLDRNELYNMIIDAGNGSML